jgi:peroxiredoxin
MLPLGTKAPDFRLPEPATGNMVALADFNEAPAFLLIVLSNHCPFVKHIASGIADFAGEYGSRGMAIVAVNANDTEKYPADSPARMVEEVALRGYRFPYLFDETQTVVKSYGAACTPEFFLFDGERRLVYRGQFDDSRPSLEQPVTGADLRAACDAVLSGALPDERQIPSVGCNIKWKAGNAPPWFT